MRARLATLLVLLALVGGARAAAQEPIAAPPVVTIDLRQSDGRLNALAVTNLTYDGAAGLTGTPEADPAFQWLRQTNTVRYVRIANWLGDGFLKRDPQTAAGTECYTDDVRNPYRWEGVIAALDTLVASGVKPVLVCGGVPDALAAGEPIRADDGSLANPPEDLREYGLLITRAIKELERVYGRDEVRTWYFEAWNAPDVRRYWQGAGASSELPRSDPVAAFCALYDVIAGAVFAADSRLRVGGPGVASDDTFLARFVEHCVRSTSSVSGGRRSQLDFISWQQVGTAAATAARAGAIAAMLERDFPELAETPLLITKWAPSPVDGVAAPAPEEPLELVRLLTELARLSRPPRMVCRQGDLMDDHFGGQRPLITRLDGLTVPNQTFRVFEMLAKLGDERLAAPGVLPPGWQVLAARPSSQRRFDVAQMLVSRDAASGAASVALRLEGLPGALARLFVRVYRVDEHHYNTHAGWLADGAPNPASRELAEELLGPTGPGFIVPAAESPAVEVRGGVLSYELALPPGGVALLALGVEPALDVRISRRGQRVQSAEVAYLSAAELHFKGELRQAAQAYRDLAKRFDDTQWAISALQTLARLYQRDLGDISEARQVRAELLTKRLTRQERADLLRQQLIDAAREGDQATALVLRRDITLLETELRASRRWASDDAPPPAGAGPAPGD